MVTSPERTSTIFYSDTSEGALDCAAIFSKVVREFGFRPAYFVGLKKGAQGTTQEAEMRSEIARASLAVVRLGPPTRGDNLALDFLDNEIEARGMRCVVLVPKEMATVSVPERATKTLVGPEGSTPTEFEAELRTVLTAFVRRNAN